MPLESHAQEKTIETDTNSRRFEEILEEQGYLVYTTRGISMMPLIRQHKDIVEVQPLAARPKKYDVCLYKRGTKYVLHRCISATPLIFAGDHNTFKEYDVTQSIEDMSARQLRLYISRGAAQANERLKTMKDIPEYLADIHLHSLL